ncbi:MAG: hypothetical protein DI603_12590 [Roseateles depolymerans]|uniref:Uncharacterized protein n=1 Tax=Roseateles depolymerans TaxID=76731 RepID=A0A2W5DKN3_9BURK|nr:MAG: hypothetical protein DI603_12590 [Roseateles depolymerans]
MEDVPERRFTPVHSTPLGTRYVLMSDIPRRLQDHCEFFARSRRALLLLPEGSTAVFYEDWLLWADSIDVDSNPPPLASGGVVRAERVRFTSSVPQFRCDRCGAAAQYSADDGLTNLLQLSFDSGSGNVFGDSKRLDIDICHGCLRETFGPWLRVV